MGFVAPLTYNALAPNTGIKLGTIITVLEANATDTASTSLHEFAVAAILADCSVARFIPRTLAVPLIAAIAADKVMTTETIGTLLMDAVWAKSCHASAGADCPQSLTWHATTAHNISVGALLARANQPTIFLGARNTDFVITNSAILEGVTAIMAKVVVTVVTLLPAQIVTDRTRSALCRVTTHAMAHKIVAIAVQVREKVLVHAAATNVALACWANVGSKCLATSRTTIFIATHVATSPASLYIPANQHALLSWWPKWQTHRIGARRQALVFTSSTKRFGTRF
ncbi:MAG TPA: hypothetical protein VLA25_05740 [Methylotenera sp.]|nr:hypothetical protein [Methylotenera sp.]